MELNGLPFRRLPVDNLSNGRSALSPLLAQVREPVSRKKRNDGIAGLLLACNALR